MVDAIRRPPQYVGDIEPQKRGLGYKYDLIGNLIADEREDLSLSWYANGKVREVTRGAGVVDLPDLAFTYDGTGRRTTKLLRTRSGTELDKDTYWSKTYYFRDAQGNVMAVYRRRWNGQVAGGYSFSDMLTLTEQHLYGSDRLGLRRPDLDAASRPYTITGANGPITIKQYGPETTTAHPNPARATYDLGRNRYELTNHLGNVLATVSDNVWAITQTGTLQSFGADVKSATDYYGFGMGMPGRDFNVGNYRYGFNGIERDDELKGSGNSLDFGARMYDPRLGRFLSPDPLMSQNATWSPYAFALDNPIMFVDENGEWPGVTFMFFEVEAGAGLGYGLNYIEQSGIAYDEVGKTHFTLTSAVYIVNQNLERDSHNPQFVLGASAGLSGGVTQNWSAETFSGALGLNTAGYGIPTGGANGKGKAKVKAKLGVGITFSEDDFTLTLGLQAGVKFTRLSTSVSHSISLTDSEADVVNDATDVVVERWVLNNVTDITDDEGTITGFSATVATRNTKGELIDTGVQVFSGATTDDDGTVQSSGVWQSRSYQTEAAQAEKEGQ